MVACELFLMLLLVHFVADYPLQGDVVARGKNKYLDPALYGVRWWYWMSGHAATHALGVYVLTKNAWLAVLEFVVHFAVDHGKCAKKYGLDTDQALHIITKFVIALLYVYIVVPNYYVR